MKKLNQNYKTLIYLLGCAVNGMTPERSRIQISDGFLKLSRGHMVSALAAHALSPFFNDRELFTETQAVQWQTEKNNSVRRSVMYNAERNAVIEMLEQNHIWYVPLKGSVLQNDYPEMGLREMSDVDILFDKSRAEDIRDIMLTLGYTVKDYGKTHHDAYEKKPIYEFEMHRGLFREKAENLYNYYKNAEKRLIKVGEKTVERRFTADDFFVYLLAHACNHMELSGTGIRTLLDLYIYSNKERIDFGYVDRELVKIGVQDNARLLMRLSQLLFAKENIANEPVLEENDREILAYIMSSGSTGSHTHAIENRVKQFSEPGKSVGKKEKSSYLMSRIFLKPEKYKHSYPFFYQHKWARPFLIFVRLPNVIVKRKSIRQELDIVKNTK